MTGDLSAQLRRQAQACAALGSPMYAALLTRAADVAGDGGPLDRVLAGHEHDPPDAALPLRLLGTVHRLVLEREAGALAASYPSVGGRFDLDVAWPRLLDLLDQRVDDVRAGLLVPPQTNEVGRAAALVGALLRLPGTRLPVRLVELGASGGLNLRADRFRYGSAGRGWGPEASPVLLPDAWAGAATPIDRPLVVVERLGCDPDPVDPTTTAGRTLLTAYVWPDQRARLERLRGALEVAASVPAEVRRQRARDLVDSLAVRAGTCTVLWHSVMWQYLDADERAAVRDGIDRLGTSAGADAPFVHLALEPVRTAAGPADGHAFPVVAEQWPHRPDPTVLGTARPHGPPVTWDA